MRCIQLHTEPGVGVAESLRTTQGCFVRGPQTLTGHRVSAPSEALALLQGARGSKTQFPYMLRRTTFH